jgi:hypothetical protein
MKPMLAIQLLRTCDSQPHTCFRGRPRPIFCCVLPIARAPVIGWLVSFNRGCVFRPFPPLCLPCAWSRASNLATKALAFPISYGYNGAYNPNPSFRRRIRKIVERGQQRRSEKRTILSIIGKMRGHSLA